MDYRISVEKDGKELASEVISNPTDDDINDAIRRVRAEARKAIGGSLWNSEVYVRHAS
jgi:hypothetical protein